MIGKEDIAILEHENQQEQKKKEQELSPEKLMEQRLEQARQRVDNLQVTGLSSAEKVAESHESSVDEKTKGRLAGIAEKAKTVYGRFEKKISEYVENRQRAKEYIGVVKQIRMLLKSGNLDEALKIFNDKASWAEKYSELKFPRFGKSVIETYYGRNKRDFDRISWDGVQRQMHDSLFNRFLELKKAENFDGMVNFYRGLEGYKSKYEPVIRLSETGETLMQSCVRQISMMADEETKQKHGKQEYDDEMREEYEQMLLQKAPSVLARERVKTGHWFHWQYPKENILRIAEAVIRDGVDLKSLAGLDPDQFPDQIPDNVKTVLFEQYSEKKIIKNLDFFEDKFGALPEDEQKGYVGKMVASLEKESEEHRYIDPLDYYYLYQAVDKGQIKAEWISRNMIDKIIDARLRYIVEDNNFSFEKLDRFIEKFGVDQEARARIIDLAYANFYSGVYSDLILKHQDDQEQFTLPAEKKAKIMNNCNTLNERYGMPPSKKLLSESLIRSLGSQQGEMALALGRMNPEFADLSDQEIVRGLELTQNEVDSIYSSLENNRTEVEKVKELLGVGPSKTQLRVMVFNSLQKGKGFDYSLARLNPDFVNQSDREILDAMAFTPKEVVQIFSLEQYRLLLAPEAFDELVKVTGRYPEALTGSANDKVRPYLVYLSNQDCGFELSASGITDFSAFVGRFGLEQTPRLYQYFTNLQKVERGELKVLPAEQIADKMTSVAEMETRLLQIKEDLISGNLPSPEKMTPFDYDVLAVGTMFNTSRWARPDKNLETVYRQFAEAENKGEIKELPAGYETMTLKVERVKNNLDSLQRPEVVAEYRRFRQDLLGAYDLTQAKGLDRMKNEIAEMWQQELGALDLTTANEARFKAMRKKADVLEAGLAKVKSSSSMDDVLRALLNCEEGLNIKKENDFTSPFMRRILFHKAMTNHSGYEQLPLPMQNNSVVYLEGAQFVRDITMNVLKDHVLKGSKKEARKYFGDWMPSAQDFGRLRKILTMNNMVETMQRMEASLEGSQEEISMIPDRGFVGELSGYYSEACYTRIDQMLKNWPEAVPCKFVINPNDPQKRQIIGGVVLIEREGHLIVRANNPRDEYLNKLQASSFCEQVYNAAAKIAKRRKLKSVLVTGVPGTTSNREKINTYVKSQASDEKVVKLESSLNFNGYEIKDGCYEVRKVA